MQAIPSPRPIHPIPSLLVALTLTRAEVTSLLDAHDGAADFIEAPAYEVAADLLADDPPESLAGRAQPPANAPHERVSKRQRRRESLLRWPLPALSIGRQFLVRLGDLGLHGRVFMGRRRRSRY